MMDRDIYFMSKALIEANKALKLNEVPIGAIIVLDDKIIARGYNKRETKQNALMHAEMVAINKACTKLNSWRLNEATLYVTLEPCIMCAGAIIQSRIKRVVYGCPDFRFGAHKSFINVFDYKFNHNVNIKSGVLEDSCSKLIKDFFKDLREESRKV